VLACHRLGGGRLAFSVKTLSGVPFETVPPPAAVPAKVPCLACINVQGQLPFLPLEKNVCNTAPVPGEICTTLPETPTNCRRWRRQIAYYSPPRTADRQSAGNCCRPHRRKTGARQLGHRRGKSRKDCRSLPALQGFRGSGVGARSRPGSTDPSSCKRLRRRHRRSFHPWLE
jgi:hypothetical protein